jgi:hypothetical protein
LSNHDAAGNGVIEEVGFISKVISSSGKKTCRRHVMFIEKTRVTINISPLCGDASMCLEAGYCPPSQWVSRETVVGEVVDPD